MADFPSLVELHKQRSDKVACISLSFDYEGIGKPEDLQDKILGFLKPQGAVFDNVISSDDSDSLYRNLEIGGAIPAVLIYDRQGKQVKQFDNNEAEFAKDFFTYKQINEYLDTLLAKP